MDRILLKSFSKINIGLKIFNKRADGYHNIHTIFQEIDFHDKIILKKRNSGCSFTSNVDWLSNDESNLCVKAWQCLVERFGIAGINIELQKKKTSIIIKVEDDGPGIAESEYDNVFKPFYKIDKGRADSKSSVGLGLSIASDIVRSHGGNIKLNKSNLNGLEVKIFLPV